MKALLEPIGIVHSPFKEKFGIPRQPGLCPSSRAVIEMRPPFNQKNAFGGIEAFSHLWISFLFHLTMDRGWTPTVRPPRLGGNKRIGVFATRSTHRPNGMGLSVVEFDRVEIYQGKILIHIRNMDLLDGTPVIDIKPYLPYADSIPHASGGYAQEAPTNLLDVVFEAAAEQALINRLEVRQLIIEMLRQDPRPAYRKSLNDEKPYSVRLFDLDVRFVVQNGRAIVNGISPLQ